MAAEEYVLRDIQLGNDTRFLANQPDAEGKRVARIRDRHAPSVTQVDFSVVRLDQAEKDFHERGLAGAVFAQKRVYFAVLKIEVDFPKGADTPEGF